MRSQVGTRSVESAKQINGTADTLTAAQRIAIRELGKSVRVHATFAVGYTVTKRLPTRPLKTRHSWRKASTGLSMSRSLYRDIKKRKSAILDFKRNVGCN